MRYVGLGRDNLRSHFVFRPRHAPEWLRTWFLPIVFLANEEELTCKTFTTSLNATNPNTYVKFIFLRTAPLTEENSKLIPKTIGNRKRDCAWGGSWWYTLPEKIYRSQSTNQSAELNERLPDLCFAICRFSQVRFITTSHLTHNLFFYFQ